MADSQPELPRGSTEPPPTQGTQVTADNGAISDTPPGLVHFRISPLVFRRGFLFVNPRIPLCAGFQRYHVPVGDHWVRVMMLKRCFVIKGSPPPVLGCRNGINSQGDLTIGFGSDPGMAWVLVLAVLGLDEDGQPIFGPAPR